jgi:N-acetylglutamate synthase
VGQSRSPLDVAGLELLATRGWRGTEEAPLAAVARGVVTDDWLGVAAVTVEERYRRRGLATAVMAALQRWGADRGAHWVYLQVPASKAPARALYRRTGLIEHHRYHYRYAPA